MQNGYKIAKEKEIIFNSFITQNLLVRTNFGLVKDTVREAVRTMYV